MADDQTTVAHLKALVDRFIAERDWHQFHDPKNLSASIAIEAAELMEHFQWLTTAEAAALTQNDPAARQAIAEELADVLIYCFSLADVLAFDVTEIILAKLAKNAEKYPVESKT